MRFRFFTILVFSLLISKVILAQESHPPQKNNKFISVGVLHGKASTSSSSFFNAIDEKEDIGKFRSLSLKYGIMTNGTQPWHNLYGDPIYGIGVNVFDFHVPKTTGYPVSIYGFFNPRLYHYKRFSLVSDISLGMSFGWKHFGPNDLDNTAISLARSVYIELGATANYEITDRITLAAGFLVGHFSNGATRRPNQGVNTSGLQYSVYYNINGKKVEILNQSKPEFNKSQGLMLSIHGSTQNFQVDSLNQLVQDKFKGVSFPMWGLTGEYYWQLNHYVKLGGGINVLDDGSVGATYAIDNNEVESEDVAAFPKRLKVSVFPSFELVLYKFGILLQPGLYVIKNRLANDVPTFYQRLGARYYVTDHLFCGVNIRAFGFKSANFIEYNAGYKF